MGHVIAAGGARATVPVCGTRLGSLAVGSAVKLNESGGPVEYLVVNQGLPSSLYDASCDGTWLLRKDIFENRPWHSSSVNDYANSTIKAYLDSTFLARFDTAIKNAIKQVKIPYRPGSGMSQTVNSGANGLSCKVFLLSGYEMGWTSGNSQYFPADGAKLSYFIAGESTDANEKRIAYFEGRRAGWRLRSPDVYSSSGVWYVGTVGSCLSNDCTISYGVRTALIMPQNTLVLDDGTIQGVA